MTQEQLEELIAPGVRLVSIDYPHWTNGYLMDLHSLKTKCDEVGAWLVLDCTQSIGVVPVDVTKTPVDALVASGYKFMLCPYGTAFMYLPKKRQDEVSVTMPTWQGMINARDFSKLNEYQFSYVQNAARYDVGEHTSFLNIMGMNASLEFLLQIGVEKIYCHTLNLLDQLVSGLDTMRFRIVSDLSAQRRSAMLRVTPKGEKETQPLLTRLRENQVYVSFRDNGFRVTPHIYNNESDINRLIELL